MPVSFFSFSFSFWGGVGGGEISFHSTCKLMLKISFSAKMCMVLVPSN